MKYIPHEYQDYATKFIEKHEVSALLLDMGLGKTVSTLTAINNLIRRGMVKKVLVIAPLRVAGYTWPEEIKKWEHLERLQYSLVLGTATQRRKALGIKADIYITNRENVNWLIQEIGDLKSFDMLVIDELSSFKSYKTNRFKALLKHRRDVDRVVGLTGTPAPNSLLDLWAEFRILDNGERLGRYITCYRDAFFRPGKRNQNIVYDYIPLPGSEEEIYRKISDITISMKSQDHLKMPEKIINQVRVSLDSKERRAYDKLLKDYTLEIDDEDIDAVNAAALSNKLIQLSNGAVYDNEKGIHCVHDRKLDALDEIVEAANGKPILVAYWFKHDLSRILERYEKSSLSVKEIKGVQDFNDWNNGLIDIGLIHPQSAGHGLNLQKGGSIIVWYSLTWSLELYEQTNARLYRQGQKNTVFIHHIITEDTIDEDIISALDGKRYTQDCLIEAVKARIGKLKLRKEE